MKITISSSALLKKLQILAGVLSTSNSGLPILDNFLFETKEDYLEVTASDLDTTMKTYLIVTCKETIKFAVPARILIDILKTLPEQPLEFDVKENNTIEISSTSGKYSIAYFDAAAFPKQKEINNPSTTVLPAKILSTAITKTIFATGTDDLRPVMTGVFFDLSTTGLRFVATDAHKLVKYSRNDLTASKDSQFIMPKKPLNVLKSVLAGLEEDVTIEFNESNASFSFESYILHCRLIDGKYPNYEAVIPKDNPNQLKISRQQFLNSVNCVSIFSNKQTHQIRLNIKGNELNVSADDPDYSNKADERLTCDYTGEDIRIGFNARFMAEMLKNMQSEEIVLEMSQPNRAGILTQLDGLEEGESLLMLVMPSIIN
jgi:DNA polymerase-3 subunit beta